MLEVQILEGEDGIHRTHAPHLDLDRRPDGIEAPRAEADEYGVRRIPRPGRVQRIDDVLFVVGREDDLPGLPRVHRTVPVSAEIEPDRRESGLGPRTSEPDPQPRRTHMIDDARVQKDDGRVVVLA